MVSVLLAAYCGEAFVTEQIASVLPQLLPGDELLVSDDSPPQHSATRLAVLAFADARVRYLTGPRQGVVRNFASLLTHAKGDCLVLCDQDDVWLPGKLARVRAAMPTHKPALLHHNALLANADASPTSQTLFAAKRAAPGLLRNWLRNGYTGCCMAVTRPLLRHVLPLPAGIPMHDQWLGLVAERLHRQGRCELLWLHEPLLCYRRHAGTLTGRHTSTPWQKLIWRLQMASALCTRQLAAPHPRRTRGQTRGLHSPKKED